MKIVKRAKVKELILWACESNGIPEFAKKIKYEWSRRMTSTAGMAFSRTNSIKLSVPIMARMDMDEQHETVVHEACHLIAAHFAKLAKRRIKPHGNEWKAVMTKTGYPVNRCHKVDTTKTRKRKAGTKAFTCGCNEKVFWLGAEKAKKAIEKQAFRCKLCKEILVVRKKVIITLAESA